MVSSVQLGNFFNNNGKFTLGGAGGSGLDTENIINSLVNARKLGVTALQDKVTLNNKKSSALSDFQALVTKLKDAADLLRKVPGLSSSGNAFDYATASVTSTSGVVGSTYMNVTVEPGATIQSYTINEITSIARAHKQGTNPFTISDADQSVVTSAGSPVANRFAAGTVTVNGVAIALAEGDSLNLVASKFNSVKDQTGISATVVKLGTNSYTLSFSATETGEDAKFDLESAVNVTDPSGVFAQMTFADTQVAANAEFKLDGQPIIRQSNNISDVIQGLTFNMVQAMPLTTELDVKVTPDTTAAKNSIIGFMNAYNDIKIFAAKQAELKDDGTYADDAVLANDTVMRSAISSMGSELSKLVDGIAGGALDALASVGITFGDLQESDDNPFVRNILNLNDATLDSALASKFDQVRKIFEFSFQSSNPNLGVYTRTNNLAVTSFTLNINPGTSTYQATYTDSDGSHTIDLDATLTASADGYTLKGQAGTVLDGLVMVYGSTATASGITVSMSQGISDRLYNLSDELLEDDTGALSIEIDALKTSNDKLQEDITRMNTQLDVYRQQMVDRYSQLEQAIAAANLLLQSLDANAKARENS